MHIPRSNFGIELIDGLIFAVAGFNGQSTTPKVEYYNIRTDEWKEADDMSISRSGLSCCLVSNLPHINEYIFPRQKLRLLKPSKESSTWEDLLLCSAYDPLLQL